MTQNIIYRFYAELRDYHPKIWRRFEITGEKTVAELAYVLMILFEMQASHRFSIGMSSREWIDALLKRMKVPSGTIPEDSPLWDTVPILTRFELPDKDVIVPEGEDVRAANRLPLTFLTQEVGWKGFFSYDPDDGWKLDLRLESCETYDNISTAGYPRVLEGEGFGIIEDVGGPDGLARLAKAFSKGNGKEYQEYCEWLGVTELDLESFDREEMNLRLKKLLKVYRDISEKKLPPSAKSLALLLRKEQIKTKPSRKRWRKEK